MVEGDFNGDGALDLVVANGTFNTVSVLLGKGDGTFQPPRSVAVGSIAYRMAVGDLNGDAVLDLVVANSNSNSVSVLLGNGDGTFQDAQSFGAGIGPGFLVISDLNGDARLDLAVANAGYRHCGDLPGPCTYDSGSVSVLLGNGDGTFEAARNFEQDTRPYNPVVGDFNGDRMPDLAVIDFSSPTTISMLLGNGDGTFQPAQRLDVGSRPLSMAAADINRDGTLDLVVGASNLLVLLGNGDGTFQAPLQAESVNAMAIDIRDVNGDGVPDLTAILNVVPEAVSILLGNGDGTFQASRRFGTGGGDSLAVGDFNADGVPDAAVTGGRPYSGGLVAVLLGLGDGTLLAAPTYRVGRTPLSVAAADFNGDAKADLVTANYSADTISVLLGRGDGDFQPAQDFAVGIGPLSVAVGDLDGDGVADVVTANYSGTVSVLLGNGDGTFPTARNVDIGSNLFSVALGDFNGDGGLDLVVVTAVSFISSGYVSVLLGNGDGTFQASRTLSGEAGPVGVAMGDFNHDGILDLAVANNGVHPSYSASVSVSLGNGNGTFRFTRNYATGDRFSSVVAVGDFDGDMTLDLVVAKGDSIRLSVLIGNGDGTFQDPVAASGPPFGAVTVGDFNRDAKLDLVILKSGDVLLLLGDGDGTFQTELAFGIHRRPSDLALGDFDGDGNTDLAVSDIDFDVVSELLATKPATYALSVSRAGNGGGTVTSSSTPDAGSQISCGTACTATYSDGTQVILTAYADVGSTFAGWSGCDEESGTTCTVAMNGAKSVVATFDLQRFGLTVMKDGIGRGIVTSRSDPASSPQINCGTICSADYDWNTVVTLRATPALGSLFLGWRGCDAVSRTTCTVTIGAARSVTATFQGLPLAFRSQF